MFNQGRTLSVGASKESERRTRRQRVNPRLTAAGWRIVRESDFDSTKPLAACDRCAIEEFSTDNGPADYALCIGGRVLAVVEAKKVTLGPQDVLTQAERCVKGLLLDSFDFRGLRAPFLYSTNGEVLWCHDVRHKLNRSHKVAHFHTPQALGERLARDTATP